MSSQNRVETSRRNGALSRGPKTPEGRRASSQNAITHGLTAEMVVLNNEDQGQFDLILANYVREFNVVGQIEHDLVAEMVASVWRRFRLVRMESDFLNYRMQQEVELTKHTKRVLTKSEHQGAAWMAAAGKNDCLNKFSRHDSRIRKYFRQTLEELAVLQSARKQGEMEDRRRAQVELQNEPRILRQPYKKAPLLAPIPVHPVIEPQTSEQNRHMNDSDAIEDRVA
jgi:hypothetical protein